MEKSTDKLKKKEKKRDGKKKKKEKETVGHGLTMKKHQERTEDVKCKRTTEFSDFFLKKEILEGLNKSGFCYPSPIQELAIPVARMGADVIVQAKSGTGKTCVFSVIALENLNLELKYVQVLILAPTREIAIQIYEVTASIGQCLSGLEIGCFIGGVPLGKDIEKLAKCHVAVGTPGRVQDLIRREVLKTSHIRLLVLDEADNLISKHYGHNEQINWIYSVLPEFKQMIAASATYPEQLEDYIKKYMKEPQQARLNPGHQSLLGLKQYYVVAKNQEFKTPQLNEKVTLLHNFLKNQKFNQALVFSNSHITAQFINKQLSALKWPAAYISSQMEQERRNDAVRKLKNFQCRILITTDLTARGVDAKKVDCVVNFDVPYTWAIYLHRIGRAGRFGGDGTALTIVSPSIDQSLFCHIVKLCNLPIDPYPEPIYKDGYRKIIDLQTDNSELPPTKGNYANGGWKRKTQEEKKEKESQPTHQTPNESHQESSPSPQAGDKEVSQEVPSPQEGDKENTKESSPSKESAPEGSKESTEESVQLNRGEVAEVNLPQDDADDGRNSALSGSYDGPSLDGSDESSSSGSSDSSSGYSASSSDGNLSDSSNTTTSSDDSDDYVVPQSPTPTPLPQQQQQGRIPDMSDLLLESDTLRRNSHYLHMDAGELAADMEYMCVNKAPPPRHECANCTTVTSYPSESSDVDTSDSDSEEEIQMTDDYKKLLGEYVPVVAADTEEEEEAADEYEGDYYDENGEYYDEDGEEYYEEDDDDYEEEEYGARVGEKKNLRSYNDAVVYCDSSLESEESEKIGPQQEKKKGKKSVAQPPPPMTPNPYCYWHHHLAHMPPPCICSHHPPPMPSYQYPPPPPPHFPYYQHPPSAAALYPHPPAPAATPSSSRGGARAVARMSDKEHARYARAKVLQFTKKVLKDA